MAASINASTSAGVVTTADTSGNLNLQSNGTTIIGYTSTGVTVTGTLSSTGSVTTDGNATGIGIWTTPTFAAGNFTASGSMTWTVPSAATYEYMIIGKTMWIIWKLASTTIAGTPSTTLSIAIPASKTAAKGVRGSFTYQHVGGLGNVVAGCEVAASASTISLYVDLSYGASNWTASAGNFYAYGTIVFEIS